jgi:hypothetical protein
VAFPSDWVVTWGPRAVDSGDSSVVTAVPGAIDGLIAMARSAALIGGSGVRVDDGPWMSPPPEQELLVVGWVPIEGPTVAWVADLETLGASRPRDESETFDVHNLIRIWRPDAVLKAARDRADEIFEALRAAVRADHTLQRAVDHAQVAAQHLTSKQNSTGGCSVSIELVVQCQVF